MSKMYIYKMIDPENKKKVEYSFSEMGAGSQKIEVKVPLDLKVIDTDCGQLVESTYGTLLDKIVAKEIKGEYYPCVYENVEEWNDKKQTYEEKVKEYILEENI